MPTVKKAKKTTSAKTTSKTTAAPVVSASQSAKRLSKSASDKVFCGVAAGIADYLAIDPVLIRLLFVILTISGGSGLLIYIVLCLIVPEENSKAASTKEVISENGKDLEEKIETAAANVEKAVKQKKAQTWVGFGIVVLGIMLMANNVGIFALQDIVRYVAIIGWPLALIVLGLIILNKHKDD
jgi:phage shock protein PspC (stress-responsive transcriptional regulator)